MSGDDDPVQSAPPPGTRVRELEVGGQTLVVISFPLEPCDASAWPLSPAESEVARMAIEGLTNAEIAQRRGTSVRTVANQMASLLHKLDLGSRRELAARYPHGGPRRERR